MRDGDDGRDSVLEVTLLGVGLYEGVDAGRGRDNTPRTGKCDGAERGWEVLADIVSGLVVLVVCLRR